MTSCADSSEIPVGRLLDDYSSEDSVLCLDLSTFNRHVFISGSTGSGKTVLLRRLIEQAALHGVSSIVFDIKGDLAKLAIPRSSFYDWELESQTEEELLEQVQSFFENTRVHVATVGVNDESLNLGPFSISLVGVGKDTLKELSFSKAEGVAHSLPLPSSAIMPITTYLYHVFMKAALKRYEISSPEGLLYVLNNDLYKPSPKDAQLTSTVRTKLIQGLQHIQAGPRGAIYGKGRPFSLDYLLEQEKPSIFVISLQNVVREDRVRLLGNALRMVYQWIKQHPFPELKLLVAIDELLGLAPPVKKTSAKDSLTVLSTQGRQFGIGLLLATQQPVQVDHMILSQFNTIIIGRHPGRNDREYIRTILKGTETSLVDLDDVLAKIATAQAGEFYVLRVGKPPTPFKAFVGYSEFEGPPLTSTQLNNLIADQNGPRGNEHNGEPVSPDDESIADENPVNLPKTSGDQSSISEDDLELLNEDFPLPPDEELQAPSRRDSTSESSLEAMTPSNQQEHEEKPEQEFIPKKQLPEIKISDIDYFTIDKKSARLYKAAKEAIGDIEVLKRKIHEVLIYQQQVLLEFKPGYILKNPGPKQSTNQITAFTDWQILPETFPSILPSKEILRLVRSQKFNVNVKAPVELGHDDQKIIESLTKHRTRELFDEKSKIHEKIKQAVTIDLKTQLPSYQQSKQQYSLAEQALNEKIKELDGMMKSIKSLETQIQQKQKALAHTRMQVARDRLESDINALATQIKNKKQVIEKHVKLAKNLKDQRKETHARLREQEEQIKKLLLQFKSTPTKDLLTKIIVRRRVLSLQVYELDVRSLAVKDADAFIAIWIPSFNRFLIPCWRCLFTSIEDAYGVPVLLCEDCGKPICEVHMQVKKRLLGKEVHVCKPSCREN